MLEHISSLTDSMFLKILVITTWFYFFKERVLYLPTKKRCTKKYKIPQKKICFMLNDLQCFFIHVMCNEKIIKATKCNKILEWIFDIFFKRQSKKRHMQRHLNKMNKWQIKKSQSLKQWKQVKRLLKVINNSYMKWKCH